MKESFLNLNHFLPCTEAEGPGKRFCIWTQGCNRRCPGCCNEEMLEIRLANLISTKEIQEEISKAIDLYDLEGVTFLGGEPMIQAKGLREVARFAQEKSLSVMIFTGYQLEYLESGKLPYAQDLLSHCDVLVDGTFDNQNLDLIRNWSGSQNQKFHYLTQRYNAEIETDQQDKSSIEIRINDLSVQGNGCPFTLDELIKQTF